MQWLKEDTKDVFIWKKSFPLFNFWHAKDQKWEWDHFITAEKGCKVTKNWRRISAAVWYYCSAGKERNKKADLYLRSSSMRCSSDVHLTMVSGDPRLRISEFYRVEFQFCSCGNKLIFFFLINPLKTVILKLYLWLRIKILIIHLNRTSCFQKKMDTRKLQLRSLCCFFCHC